MSGQEILNLVILVMALTLFCSAVWLLRPANGTRPLLIGFMASALYGVAVGVTRTFSLQSTMRPMFGVITLVWLTVKLWGLWSVALKTYHPFLRMARNFWRRAWGMAE